MAKVVQRDATVYNLFISVNLSTFLNINQNDALNFYNKFISSLYMFRAHVLEKYRGLK